MIKPEDKAFVCKHRKNGYCSKIKHEIYSGYASRTHCGGCTQFINKENNEQTKMRIEEVTQEEFDNTPSSTAYFINKANNGGETHGTE